MNAELQKKNKNIELPLIKTKIRTNQYPLNLSSINIIIIGAVGFHRNLQKEGNVAFIISLYEIDRMIEKKRTQKNDDEETDKQAIKRLLLKEYKDLKKEFLKVF